LSLSAFFFTDTAPTECYTLSLHDALPILGVGDLRRHTPLARSVRLHVGPALVEEPVPDPADAGDRLHRARPQPRHARRADHDRRSEEHTSELQSLRHLVCRLLLEKKKTKT